MYSRPKALALHLIFAFSGAAATGSQLIWLRQFSVGLGQETGSFLGVLTACCAGFGAGAWLLDRPIAATNRPGMVYGILEIAAGLWTMVSVFLLPRFTDLALSLNGIDTPGFVRWATAFLLSALALFPATVARGGLFAAVERVASPLVLGGRCAGSLCAVNLLGGAGGAIGLTFAFLPEFGSSRSLILLGICGCLAGIAVWSAFPRGSTDGLFVEHGGRLWNLFFGVFPSAEERTSVLEQGITGLRLPLTLVGAGLLGTGCLVSGRRLLNHYLENSVYSEAAMVTCCLLAASVGALLANCLRPDRAFRDRLSLLAGGLAASCATGLVALAFSSWWQPVLAKSTPFSSTGLFLSEALTAAVFFGIPCALMGALFVSLVQWCRDQNEGIGYALALQVAGCAGGCPVFALWLPPALGTVATTVLAGLGYLALIPRGSAGPLALSGTALLLSTVALWSLEVTAPLKGERVLATREGANGTASVLVTEENQRLLRVNNYYLERTTANAAIERRRTHLPLLLHPRPKKALFLGSGAGIADGAAAWYPGLSAEVVEPASEVAALRRFFTPADGAPTNHPQLHVAGSRRFVLSTPEAYDVVVAAPFQPARGDAAYLCTRECFQSIRDRVGPHGLFCQWLALHLLDEASFRSIVRTFLEVFPDAHALLLYPTLDTPTLGLVSRVEPMRSGADRLPLDPFPEDLRLELRAQGIQSLVDVYGHLLAGPRTLAGWAAGAPGNSDDRPYVRFQAPRLAFRRDTIPYARLLGMIGQRGADLEADLGEAIGLSDQAPRVHRCLAARDIYLLGLVAEKERSPRRALTSFVESARVSEDFSFGYERALALAIQQSKEKPEEAKALLLELCKARPSSPAATNMIQSLFGNHKTDS